MKPYFTPLVSKEWWTRLAGKLFNELQSRKFWALVAALVAIGQAVGLGEITQWQAIQALVAALAAYAGSVALDRQ